MKLLSILESIEPSKGMNEEDNYEESEEQRAAAELFSKEQLETLRGDTVKLISTKLTSREVTADMGNK